MSLFKSVGAGKVVVKTLLYQFIQPAGIKPQKNKKQYGKSPEGRSAIAEKRERNADDGHQAQRHSDIDDEMGKEDGCHRIAVNPGKYRSLSFGKKNQPQKKKDKKRDDSHRTHKTPFLPYGTENKVSALKGHKVKFSLGTLQKSLTQESTRTNCNFALIDVISCTQRIRLIPSNSLIRSR